MKTLERHSDVSTKSKISYCYKWQMHNDGPLVPGGSSRSKCYRFDTSLALALFVEQVGDRAEVTWVDEEGLNVVMSYGVQ